MINPLEAKKVITNLVAHIETYLAAIEAGSMATMFGGGIDEEDEEIQEANRDAEAVYPKLMETIQEARRLIT